MRLIGSRPLRLTIGFLCGLFCALVIYASQNALVYMMPHIRENCARLMGGGRAFSPITMNSRPSSEPSNNKQLLLVGIMTAAKYIDTRAIDVWRTWAQKIPGKVLFFVAEDTVSAHPELPIIRLKGVDDTYPPQKKSFAMMRWMYDNHLNDFEWFMRADDDLYVRGDRLEEFLRSLDSGKAHLLGQAGLGNSAEYGQLALGPQENYCMGGPGVIVSRETLNLVAPHLQSCLLSLLTTHEDVELGRCIKKHVGISCTWNYEMQTLFHNNQTQANVYEKGGAAELRKSITLHPVKDPVVMRKLHVEAESLKLDALRARKISLERELNGTPASLSRRVANTTNDLQIWDYNALNKITFCANQVTCPRHTIDSNVRAAIGNVVTQASLNIKKDQQENAFSCRVLQFQNIQYGYLRVEPRFGADYVLDMILWFKKFRLPHRATLSVRRHAYIQQTFAAPQAISERQHRQIIRKRASYENPNAVSSELTKEAILQERIHLIMPLKGRSQTFQRFASNLKQVLPPDENQIELIIICYQSNSDEDAVIRDKINEMATFLPTRVIEMGTRPFSRGQALSAGSSTLPTDALLFFTDVDMLFTYETLQRVRLNTVYFPIVFSEFSSKYWNVADRNDPHMHFNFNRQHGYFRHFGYGLVSIFKQDFDNIGGFNLSIQGWGLEDVNLFEKCVGSKHLRVFRSPDPGLVHAFHKIECPADIPTSQRHMCVGSKYASLASADWLSEQFSQFA
ncbi:Hexosyltransferase [Aphelenchoides bicaudatus]|nr:Hexosyltransferase [Aphelenchoides bicaudatus]